MNAYTRSLKTDLLCLLLLSMSNQTLVDFMTAPVQGGNGCPELNGPLAPCLNNNTIQA